MTGKLVPSKKRAAVALLVETSNAFSREVLHGVRDWMREHGAWAIHLSETGRGNQPPEWLKHWKGEGILARIENREMAAAVRKTGLPVVNVSAADVAAEFPSVVSDSAGIAQLAAQHLIERGLRHFGYCGDERFIWAQRHGDNFARQVRQAGGECSVFPVRPGDASDWKGTHARLKRWLDNLPKPAGVMTCYDIKGQQVLDVCRAAGLRVPDEVAVISQHNDELLCELCDPPLSSVVPDARRVGYEAAVLLDGWIRGKRPAALRMEIPPVRVAVRQSTDLIAVGDVRLADAMRFLRQHACGAITVDDIARVAGMSRSLLERKFREAFRSSPWDHVIQLRLREAERLLKQTGLTVAEIALKAGFGTPEHFSATFRRLTGHSPRAGRGKRGREM